MIIVWQPGLLSPGKRLRLRWNDIIMYTYIQTIPRLPFAGNIIIIIVVLWSSPYRLWGRYAITRDVVKFLRGLDEIRCEFGRLIRIVYRDSEVLTIRHYIRRRLENYEYLRNEFVSLIQFCILKCYKLTIFSAITSEPRYYYNNLLEWLDENPKTPRTPEWIIPTNLKIESNVQIFKTVLNFVVYMYVFVPGFAVLDNACAITGLPTSRHTLSGTTVSIIRRRQFRNTFYSVRIIIVRLK